MRKALMTLVVAMATLALLVSGATAAPDAGKGSANGKADGKAREHNHESKLGKTQKGLREIALQAKAQGKAKGKVYEVAKGQYVDLEQTGDDPVFVILAEFGETIHPLTGGTPGPMHNEIAEPDRETDNSTIWQADFDPAHYEDMYFNQMDDYYKAQSSGRYGVHGDVQAWVKVEYNEARYGSNRFGDAIVWDLIKAAVTEWVAGQKAAGKSDADIAAYLKKFDVYDRYDHDGDGNFDEADGYIDHFQIVHAGAGEETGGGAQGEDAIWSHRWYAFYNGTEGTGPGSAPFGGLQIGDTGVWMGDYTIQPENGGLGVFAHEFAHDLGLPDHYDTSYLGENSSAFWTLMSSGSYLGDGTTDIGSTPGDMSAWDKFALGWLNYDVATAGKTSSHKLGPAEINTRQAQGLFVVLPQRERELQLATPASGSHSWWSGKGNSLDNTMTRTVTVPAAPASLSMKLWYEIEVDWDYAYVSVSPDNGATWSNLPSAGTTTTTDPNGQNFGNGITGSSAGWKPVSFDVSAWAGQTVQLRLRYWTDGFVEEKGLLADDITLGTFSDGAESGDNGWTLKGFKVSTGLESSTHNNYYVAEYRQYRGYDAGLRSGPYNFGFANTRPDWVEHFPYQDGLLISYWDTYWGEDNSVGAHPGEGFLLPIDANPTPLLAPDGAPWRTRIQVYDAPFGLESTDAITLHQNSVSTSHPSLPAQPAFDDTKQYWFASKPDAGVKVPATGTTVEVVGTSAQGNFMQVNVKPSK